MRTKQSIPGASARTLRKRSHYVKSKRRRSFRFQVLGALCGLGLSTAALALEFTPSESEWAAWPDYCRARYIVSGAGIGSSFENRISQAQLLRQQSAVGEEAWYWLHHYCAGLVYLTRADREIDENRVNYWLGEADANIMGHYRRIGRDNPMFPEFIIGVARLQRELGSDDAALRYLQEAMESHPGASSPYAYAAQILRENRRLDDAVRVLQEGDSVLNGQSAEIHYFLAHVFIDLKDMNSAVEHAKRAYELGYPLPGLAAKLDRMGHSVL